MADVMQLKRESDDPVTEAAQLSVAVAGMTCASCVGHVEKAIAKLPGVTKVSVNLATERADVTFAGAADPQALVAAIERAGYQVPESEVEIGVGGMTCASCVGHVEKALSKVSGVSSATVNLATERASVRYRASIASLENLEAAIRGAGYEPRRIEGDDASSDQQATVREQELDSLRRSLLLAAVLALPVFVLEMGSHLIPAMHHFVMTRIGMQTSWLIQFALTTLVLFGPGLRFFQKGIPAILRGTPDMNSLVTLGTSAAWGYSLVATFAPAVLPPGTANVYYEAAAVIVALILLGRYLEAKAKGRTSEAIKRLVGLQAKTARVVRDGATLEIAIGEVQAGDIVQVRPGERGQDLIIARDYISHGLRERACELVDLDLGPRSDKAIEQRLRAEIEQQRLTSIDRVLIRDAEENILASAKGRGAFDQTIRMGRLDRKSVV